MGDGGVLRAVLYHGPDIRVVNANVQGGGQNGQRQQQDHQRQHGGCSTHQSKAVLYMDRRNIDGLVIQRTGSAAVLPVFLVVLHVLMLVIGRHLRPSRSFLSQYGA